METCIRGFSFIPESKVEVMDMQFIEKEELERTWKTTRRERLKQQEQKIWDEFVKEKDVVYTLCKDDPYQFLDHLPESCLKELMEIELQRMKKEKADEERYEQHQDSPGGSPHAEGVQHTVTFADEEEKEETDMFHIFDSEKDEDPSGAEDEVLNDSLCSPCTVRENQTDNCNSLSPDSQKKSINDKESSKSSENVTSVIESSIYCARVKDLQIKMEEEIKDIIKWLDCQDVQRLEADEAARACKRAAQYSARFNRVHLYQLQRQMHDIKRHSGQSLPFAKHTHFQSQMVRIVSLHQNLLQSYQALHKSFEQTACLGESVETLHSLTRLTRDVATLCRAISPPTNFAPPSNLFDDSVVVSCDELDATVDEYSRRMNDFLQNTKSRDSSTKKMSKFKGKKRSFGAWSKSNSKSDAEARLSMYSLDTLRINLNPKSCSSKDNQSSGTCGVRGASAARAQVNREGPTPNSSRKSARIGAPRMRAPGSRRGGMRPPPTRHDHDPHTMVEAVETCASSHISREASPRGTPRNRKEVTPRRRSNNQTPRSMRSKDATPRKSQTTSPHPKIRTLSPKAKIRRSSPKTKETIKAVLSSIQSDPHDTTECSQIQLTPVSKIKSTKKASDRFDDNGKVLKGNKDIVDSDQVTEESDKILENGGSSRHTPRVPSEYVWSENKIERDRDKPSNMAPARCEVTRLLKQLCSGDGSGRKERVSGAKNAQLLCINGGSPRQPSTPQLLRILEETIKKKLPKPVFQKSSVKDLERYRLIFNIPDKTAANLFQYRTKFVQHMLSSPLYANSAVGKPWEMIGSVSDKIIDEVLLSCVKEMELQNVIHDLYKSETN